MFYGGQMNGRMLIDIILCISCLTMSICYSVNTIVQNMSFIVRWAQTSVVKIKSVQLMMKGSEGYHGSHRRFFVKQTGLVIFVLNIILRNCSTDALSSFFSIAIDCFVLLNDLFFECKAIHFMYRPTNSIQRPVTTLSLVFQKSL